METYLRGLVPAQQLVSEIRLGERLPSRKGQAPSRSTEEDRVFFHLLEYFVHGDQAAGDRRRITGAAFGAVAAELASVRVYVPIPKLIQRNRMVGTPFHAESALEAFFFAPNHLRLVAL